MGQVRRIVVVVGAALLLPGCARQAMREQAAALARAGELLERETASFTAARTAVVQLRQRSLVEQKAEVAERGQQNAATLAQWRVAGTEERAKRLALFEGVRAASEAMYEVRDESMAWNESVLATRSALAVDRSALHRFVLQLVGLAVPGKFVDEVKFYVEFGGQVTSQVDGGLQDVLAGAAEAEPESGGGSGGGGGPGTPPGATEPPTQGEVVPPGEPPRPGTGTIIKVNRTPGSGAPTTLGGK
jgi:hypothetical protein